MNYQHNAEKQWRGTFGKLAKNKNNHNNVKLRPED